MCVPVREHVWIPLCADVLCMCVCVCVCQRKLPAGSDVMLMLVLWEKQRDG